MLTVPTLGYGQTHESRIRAAHIRQDLKGIGATIQTPGGSFHLYSPLVGRHNLENILGATGVGLALGVGLETIRAGIEAVSAVPGRLERIPNRIERFVFVDYAHTPDALDNVLTALKAVTRKRIICIFGCGGDRDRRKRPQMGEIAGRLADLAIVTSDNPRTESPATIIEQIQEGIVRTSPQQFRISDLEEGFTDRGHVIAPDRRSAIELGIFVSRPGDAVLIAGKGHEPYQIIGMEAIPFDDRIEADIALKRLANKQTGGRAGI
jgi:UDP-N-acetylmuramoyl-L-alanyl-D-glutamate--2,6-diaminopimelate ligase/murE/murF fusion protein